MITGTVARVIVAELESDPLTRGYSGMTDAQRLADLNTVYRTQNKASISGDDAFTATDGPEFVGLTDHKQLAWLSWTGKSEIDPFNQNNIDFVNWIFGAGSDTISNLAGIRTEDVSRSTELIGKDLTDAEWAKVVDVRDN